jgi:hypothetical protein
LQDADGRVRAPAWVFTQQFGTLPRIANNGVAQLSKGEQALVNPMRFMCAHPQANHNRMHPSNLPARLSHARNSFVSRTIECERMFALDSRGCKNAASRARRLGHSSTRRRGGATIADGSSGVIEDAFEAGDRVVVAFRPDRHGPDAWPLDHGIRYIVLSLAGDQVSELKGCADRATALAYAETA